MISKVVSRLMQSYFIVYFSIAVVQFLLFSFMQNIEISFFIMSGIWIVLLVWIAGKMPNSKALIMFSLIGIALKFIWIVFVQTPAISDYALMYDSAREILTGGREYLNNIYYLRFPYQVGFTVYQAMILGIIDSVSGLKFVNVIWCAIASAAVYGIAREAFNQEIAKLAMLLHITLLPILVFSSVLTNQHITASWLYIGIYIWIKYGRNTWWAPILVGIALSIGTIMRPIGIVVIAAIIVNELLILIGRKSKSEVRGSISRIVKIVLSYQSILLLAGILMSQSGISPEGLKNNDPLWKLVAGLNSASYGSYSVSDEILLNYGYMDVEKRNELEKQIIKERLTDPKNMIKLPFVKIGKLWAEYQPTWFTFPQKQGTYFNYLGWSVSFDEVLERYSHFERAFLYILSLFAFLGVLKSIRHDFWNEKKRFLVLILGSYTFIHLIIEVQSRYLYFLFAIIVVFGAAELLNILKCTVSGFNKYFRRG